MTEKQLQTVIIQLAELTGWLVYHTHDSRRSNPGFPDLVMARGPRIIFAELKSAKGKTRPEQVKWLAALSLAHGEVYTWRPAQWHDGTIETILGRT